MKYHRDSNHWELPTKIVNSKSEFRIAASLTHSLYWVLQVTKFVVLKKNFPQKNR